MVADAVPPLRAIGRMDEAQGFPPRWSPFGAGTAQQRMRVIPCSATTPRRNVTIAGRTTGGRPRSDGGCAPGDWPRQIGGASAVSCTPRRVPVFDVRPMGGRSRSVPAHVDPVADVGGAIGRCADAVGNARLVTC